MSPNNTKQSLIIYMKPVFSYIPKEDFRRACSSFWCKLFAAKGNFFRKKTLINNSAKFHKLSFIVIKKRTSIPFAPCRIQDFLFLFIFYSYLYNNFRSLWEEKIYCRLLSLFVTPVSVYSSRSTSLRQEYRSNLQISKRNWKIKYEG